MIHVIEGPRIEEMTGLVQRVLTLTPDTIGQLPMDEALLLFAAASVAINVVEESNLGALLTFLVGEIPGFDALENGRELLKRHIHRAGYRWRGITLPPTPKFLWGRATCDEEGCPAIGRGRRKNLFHYCELDRGHTGRHVCQCDTKFTKVYEGS